MYSLWLAVKALTTGLLAAASVLVVFTLLSKAPNAGPERDAPLAAASQTATRAPYPLPGATKAPPQSQATPTRAAYPLPSTPTSRPTSIAPRLTITATVPAIVLPATATPTPRSGPILAPSGPPYSVYLPLIMNLVPAYVCAPNTNSMGVQRYWPYQSFALTDRLTLLVNLCNGNLVTQYSEFAIPSRGLPMTLIHSYNNLTGLWSYSLGVYLLANEGSSATVHEGDGSERTFLRNLDGSFAAPAGFFDRLVQNGDGTYTLTRTDQSTEQFDATGILTQMSDRHGNSITLSYSSLALSQAQAAGGQTLTFNYTSGSVLLTAK